MLTNCKLIIDTRERHVTRHHVEFTSISYTISQITTGDYTVLAPDDSIMAIIERKTLEDYASSIKDGRHANKEKLVELQRKTNCMIIYIIEGPAFPSQNDCFARIPYKHIESSIFHVMMRERASIIRTKDSLDTAKTLVRFMHSMDTLIKSRGYVSATPLMGANEPIEAPSAAVESTAALLTKKHVMSDHDVVRAMWSCFPGISVESADEYMVKWSLRELINGTADIKTFKLSSGRKASKKVIEVLSRPVPPKIAQRLLSTVPGISAATASCILAETPLRRLLSYEAPSIAMHVVTPSKTPAGKTLAGKTLGIKRSDAILKFFNYKYERVQPIITTTVDDVEINEFLDSI